MAWHWELPGRCCPAYLGREHWELPWHRALCSLSCARWLLIVPGDPALSNVTPISLLPRCLLAWSRSSCAGLHRKTLFHMEKGCLLFLCQALEHPVEQHRSTQQRGGSGGSACCLCLERAGGGLIRGSACCGGNRHSCSLVLGGGISQSMAEELQEEWMFWNVQVNMV